ncbi:NAD-dependent aldehyde dehydrogenase [Wenxinia marina DSM 24838]|uniref:NAD-dependent aldehyde dehydrogenase n=1 Tax=Wenxinia marina DSM 24838 TaxID=1123501 RepID=A0A0D0QBD8_9RHOB|nr:NAD-dependent aldehyde dehydrogenase [Wenxinia marina DSM 24838]
MQTDMLIGGAFEAGTEREETVLNPRTGETILKMPEASTDQIDRAVRAARAAFPGWSRTTPGERSAKLLAIADAVEANAEELARLEALNCGKPLGAVSGDEIPAIADCFRFFAGAVRNMHGPVAGEYLEGHTSMIRRDPIGVVASIAPWNYPLMMMTWKLAPALAGGNTVVLKPSEQTPLTSLAFARILADILPEGVVNVIVGQGGSVGDALVNHPGVDMISITGDVATGKKILGAASKGVKRTHLELGGKAPVIVYGDADLARTVEGLKAFSFYNAGQDCTAASRVYAHASIYDNFVADLTAAAGSIVYDQSDDGANEIPPLISPRQRDRVASFVERAAELKHIEITTGGAPAGGSGLLLHADRRGRRASGGRDRAARGVRPRRQRDPLHRRRCRHRLGQRLALRPRLVGLDAGHRQGDGGHRRAAIRLHLGEHALHAGERDAPRRAEAVRLRQGHVDLRARGLHRRPPRHDRALIPEARRHAAENAAGRIRPAARQLRTITVLSSKNSDEVDPLTVANRPTLWGSSVSALSKAASHAAADTSAGRSG